MLLIVDINECGIMTDNCDVNADCTNTPGSFNCVCRAGFTGDGINCAGNVLYHYYYKPHLIYS